jgi:hypothetical protein
MSASSTITSNRAATRRKPHRILVRDDGGERHLSLTQVHYEFGDAAIDALVNCAAGTLVKLNGVEFTRLALGGNP